MQTYKKLSVLLFIRKIFDQILVYTACAAGVVLQVPFWVVLFHRNDNQV